MEVLIITTMALPSIHTILRIQKDTRQWLTRLKGLSMNFITTL